MQLISQFLRFRSLVSWGFNFGRCWILPFDKGGLHVFYSCNILQHCNIVQKICNISGKMFYGIFLPCKSVSDIIYGQHRQHIPAAHPASLIKNIVCTTPGTHIAARRKKCRRDSGQIISETNSQGKKTPESTFSRNVARCCMMLQCCKVLHEYCKQAGKQ